MNEKNTLAPSATPREAPPSRTADLPTAEPEALRLLVEKIMGERTAPPSTSTPFCDFPGLVRHLPMYGERTLRNLIHKGIVPRILPPKTRKLNFHLPSVEAALLRFQRGGIE